MTSISFLAIKVYKNENETLSATIYRKPSECRNFLHYKLMHPKALKDSIPYSQTLGIKRICSETSEVIKYLKDLEDAFIKTGYQSKIQGHNNERAMSEDQKILLENKEKPSTQRKLALEHYQTLKTLFINIGIFYLSMKNYENFLIRPFIPYRRNTNLHLLIGGNCIFKNTIVCKNTKQPKQSPFNISLNNHRKDAKSQASILVCKYFNIQNHNFQQHPKFTLIEQIKNKQPLKKKEHF